MKSPILGGTTAVESPNAAANRTINLYPELTEDGKTVGYLKRCPGLELLQSIGNGPIIGMHAVGNLILVVSGSSLYRFVLGVGAALVGSLSISGDRVVMANSATEVFIACGQRGYIYNIAAVTLTEITDIDFPGALTVGYLDGYFVFNPPDAQTVWVTGILEGGAIDPLDFASAETESDELLAVAISHREAWLFGQTTTEVWYNAAGGAGFPLARIQGASVEVGIASPYAWARLDNTLVWLANDGIVYRANGYVPQRISTHAVEQWIQENVALSDTSAYSYRHNGHQFLVMNFDGADNTWCYDVATGQWHERPGWLNGEYTRHRSNAHVFVAGVHVVGDYLNGNVYRLSEAIYEDHDTHQRWARRWRALPPNTNDLMRQTHHCLQVDIESGVGLDGIGQGTDPQVMLRWSNDGGHSWGNELWRTIGRIGVTWMRVLWRRLGDTDGLRDRVYEIAGTDPVKIAIMGAELDVEAKDA